jgi:hypothetical protein
MTESEWLICQDPQAMLGFVSTSVEGGGRKLRLFALACLRRIWPRLPEQRRLEVEVAERFVDGLVGRAELRAAGDAESTVFEMEVSVFEDTPAAAASLAGYARRAAFRTAEAVARAASPDTPGGPEEGRYELKRHAHRLAEHAVQAALLRDLFGPLPFHPVTVDPSVLAWHGGTVCRLAEAAYNERVMPAGTLDPARLAVLADALEEAGCENQEVLKHLRCEEEHWRGCWLLDALLGKG